MDDQKASQMGRWVLSTVAGALLVWVLAHLRPVPALVLGLGAAVAGMVFVTASEGRRPAGRPVQVFGLMVVLAVVGGVGGWLLAEFQDVLFAP